MFLIYLNKLCFYKKINPLDVQVDFPSLVVNLIKTFFVNNLLKNIPCNTQPLLKPSLLPRKVLCCLLFDYIYILNLKENVSRKMYVKKVLQCFNLNKNARKFVFTNLIFNFFLDKAKNKSTTY